MFLSTQMRSRVRFELSINGNSGSRNKTRSNLSPTFVFEIIPRGAIKQWKLLFMTRPFYPQIVEKLVYRRLDFTSRQCVEQQRETFAIRFNQREGGDKILVSLVSSSRGKTRHNLGGGDETPLLSTLFVYSRSTKWRRVKKNCPTYGGHESDIEAAATRVNKMRRERTLTFLLLLLFFLRKKAK